MVSDAVSKRCVAGMASLDLDGRVSDPELAADRLFDFPYEVLRIRREQFLGDHDVAAQGDLFARE